MPGIGSSWVFTCCVSALGHPEMGRCGEESSGSIQGWVFFLAAGLGLVGAVPPCRCKPQSSAFFEECKQKCLNAVQQLSARVLFW